LKKIDDIYQERIAGKKNAGLDGIDSKRFDIKKNEYVQSINKKVKKGTYSFIPYAEIQMSKGRGKAPRILALPALRDQITLSCLKDFLHSNFEDSINKKLPNSYIYELKEMVSSLIKTGENCFFIKIDIKGFYDNIDREKLMNFVRRRIDKPEALKLIYKAITNPIVPRSSNSKQRYQYYTSKGVPQGLAISNILSNIYLSNFDICAGKLGLKYFRYVDDILILHNSSKKTSDILEKLRFEVSRLGLELNDEKTNMGVIGKDSIDYLGYDIKKNTKTSVRPSSFQKLIISLSNKLVYADYHKSKFLELHSDLDNETYQKVLIEDLNERITGAFNEKKKYGWLFYFSQIDDIALLHKLDGIVEKLCLRCKTLKKTDNIKSFVVGFREIHKMRLGRSSDYIPSYDNFDLRAKLSFLRERGIISSDEKNTLSESEINKIFISVISTRMKRIEMDIKGLS